MVLRATNIILLCEDKQHERFVRAFLRKWCKIDRRRIRLIPIPNGRGDAKKWICNQLPNELKAYRAKANHLNNLLIVVTDVDNITVQQRADTLNQACMDAGVESRRENERVVFIMPKWAIETWILTLNGQDVNEDKQIETRHKQVAQKLNTDIAEKLSDMCKKGGSLAITDSLKVACVEFQEHIAQYL